MTLFLDCEFNGFGGDLISLALVPHEGAEFYGVRKLPKKIHPWVKENVIPRLGQQPETDSDLRKRLAAYLRAHEGETVVADWPLDFAHFCAFVCDGDRLYGPHSLAMRLVPQEPLSSEVPHNALSDARALKEAWSNTARRGAVGL